MATINSPATSKWDFRASFFAYLMFLGISRVYQNFSCSGHLPFGHHEGTWVSENIEEHRSLQALETISYLRNPSPWVLEGMAALKELPS